MNVRNPYLRNWNIYISRDEITGHYRCDSVVHVLSYSHYATRRGWEIVAGLENLTEEEKDGLYGCYTHEHRQDVIKGIVRCLNRGEVFDPQKALIDLHHAVSDYLSKRNS